ncbi:hypothetical protein Aduo_004657 [Ancylostoma duodenale]
MRQAGPSSARTQPTAIVSSSSIGAHLRRGRSQQPNKETSALINDLAVVFSAWCRASFRVLDSARNEFVAPKNAGSGSAPKAALCPDSIASEIGCCAAAVSGH